MKSGVILNWSPSSGEVFMSYGSRKASLLLNWPGTHCAHTQMCGYTVPSSDWSYCICASHLPSYLRDFTSLTRPIRKSYVRWYMVYTFIYWRDLYTEWTAGCLKAPTLLMWVATQLLSRARPSPQMSATGSHQNCYFQCPRLSSQCSYLHLSSTFQGSELAWGWKAPIKNFFW